MKYVIEEYLDTIIEGVAAIAIIAIFSALFFSGTAAQLISNIVSGFC